MLVHWRAHRHRGPGEAARRQSRRVRGRAESDAQVVFGGGASGGRAPAGAVDREHERRRELQVQRQGRPRPRHPRERAPGASQMRRQPLRLELRDPRSERCGPHARHGGRVVLRRNARLLAACGRLHRARGPPPLQQRGPRRPPRRVGDELGGRCPLRSGRRALGGPLRPRRRDQVSTDSGACLGMHVRGRGCRTLLGPAQDRDALLRRLAGQPARGARAQLVAPPLRWVGPLLQRRAALFVRAVRQGTAVPQAQRRRRLEGQRMEVPREEGHSRRHG
mmetsp:Transcript_93966/g.271625  ORF Transcript_93966/g.271625 Transcript_93966/m.271625 type:complete len:278 (+) Transcript_93966:478-1311(+)